MAGLLKTVKSLCTPAQLYLVLSVLSVLSVFIASVSLTHLATSSAITVLYTYVLNKICQSGYSVVSWILVLLPMILLLIALTLMMVGVGFLAAAVKDGDLAKVQKLIQEKIASQVKAQTEDAKRAA